METCPYVTKDINSKFKECSVTGERIDMDQHFSCSPEQIAECSKIIASRGFIGLGTPVVPVTTSGNRSDNQGRDMGATTFPLRGQP